MNGVRAVDQSPRVDSRSGVYPDSRAGFSFDTNVSNVSLYEFLQNCSTRLTDAIRRLGLRRYSTVPHTLRDLLRIPIRDIGAVKHLGKLTMGELVILLEDRVGLVPEGSFWQEALSSRWHMVKQTLMVISNDDPFGSLFVRKTQQQI